MEFKFNHTGPAGKRTVTAVEYRNKQRLTATVAWPNDWAGRVKAIEAAKDAHAARHGKQTRLKIAEDTQGEEK